MGLTQGSYEAFCLDQAVWYFGATVNSELEQVGYKKSTEEVQNEAARTRILNRYLGTVEPKGQFADPAAFFGK